MTAEPLTTEQAREFAQRWAAGQGCDESCGRWCAARRDALTEPDRERLFAWVRERVEEFSDVPADAILADLFEIDEPSATALVRAAATLPSADPRRMVAFVSALTGRDCISHATLDGQRTLCGRSGWMSEDPWTDIGPDCLTCSRALEARR